jgi:hypothetical protein
MAHKNLERTRLRFKKWTDWFACKLMFIHKKKDEPSSNGV